MLSLTNGCNDVLLTCCSITCQLLLLWPVSVGQNLFNIVLAHIHNNAVTFSKLSTLISVDIDVYQSHFFKLIYIEAFFLKAMRVFNWQYFTRWLLEIIRPCDTSSNPRDACSFPLSVVVTLASHRRVSSRKPKSADSAFL